MPARAAPEKDFDVFAWHLGHWTAWFGGLPQVSWDGDWSRTAADSLRAAWEEKRFGEPTYKGVD